MGGTVKLPDRVEALGSAPINLELELNLNKKPQRLILSIH